MQHRRVKSLEHLCHLIHISHLVHTILGLVVLGALDHTKPHGICSGEARHEQHAVTRAPVHSTPESILIHAKEVVEISFLPVGERKGGGGQAVGFKRPVGVKRKRTMAIVSPVEVESASPRDGFKPSRLFGLVAQLTSTQA